MNYLYHIVPKNLRGNILFPLNVLKNKLPDIYEQQVRKYSGREQLLKQQIPILDCLWNDVLHFSAVNPREIKQALIEAGRNPDFTMYYYQVEPKLIFPEKAIVYLYSHTDIKDKLNEKNYISYNPDETEQFSIMPEATKEYYKEMIRVGRNPLLYHRIPHILFKGELDTVKLKIITV